MNPTHQFTNNQGHTYFGVITGQASCNAVWFLALCDDGKTWMKEPFWALGVRPI